MRPVGAVTIAAVALVVVIGYLFYDFRQFRKQPYRLYLPAGKSIPGDSKTAYDRTEFHYVDDS